MELATARTIHEHNDTSFMAAVALTKNNIINCFSGDHSGCRKKSLVCKGRAKTVNFPTYLPKRRPIKAKMSDREVLQGTIDFILSNEAAYRQRKIMNTNKVESMHLV